MCTQNEEIAISQYPEAQHWFLIRTIKAVQQENTRLIKLGRAQKRHFEAREEWFREENRILKDRIWQLENGVVETLKLC